MPSKVKIERFNKLIGKYLNGKTTPEESAFIEKYYQYFERNADLTNSLSDIEMDQIQRRMLEKLKEKMTGFNEGHSATFRNKRIKRMMAAAAITFIMVSGIIFLVTNLAKKKVAENKVIATTLHHDVAPGGTKAMITLEDGSRILLDSSANGIISKQGGIQVIKLSNGEVVYRKKDNNNSKIFINTMTTPRGGQYQLTLADGTKVWMNAESSIAYPTAFVESERTVKITGEVYFEVAKNEKQPFRVIVNDQTELRVLGTHFNVNSYADNGAVFATLLEGSVRIKNNNVEQMLKPGQQAEINNSIRLKDNIDTDLVMAWKNGYFSFNNTSLEVVMKQLARWYDVDVVYEEKKPDMKFWGGISMNSNLSQVLKILEESKVNFWIENKKIHVVSKK